jgi:hypothetical protein
LALLFLLIFFRNGNGMGRIAISRMICPAARWIEINSLFLTQLMAARSPLLAKKNFLALHRDILTSVPMDGLNGPFGAPSGGFFGALTTHISIQ